MEDTVKLALLVGAAIVLFVLFFQTPTTIKRQVTFEVPYPEETGVQNFISPSGGASQDFVPSDGDKVYADYA